MSTRLSALGQVLLLVALLVIPGLGSVDFCTAENRICSGAPSDSCCASHLRGEGTGEEKGKSPCCVTLQRDWMLPGKVLALSWPAPLPGPDGSMLFEERIPPPVVESISRVGRTADPPPPLGKIYLALIQVRLV